MTGRKDSKQKVSDGEKDFAIHYPKVTQQRIENPTYFLLSISIAILFALKQHRKSNTNIFPFSYITYLSVRSQCDLENPLNDLKGCSKKYIFLMCY